MIPVKRGYFTSLLSSAPLVSILEGFHCMCTLHSTVLVEALIIGICVCIYIHTVYGSNELRTPL